MSSEQWNKMADWLERRMNEMAAAKAALAAQAPAVPKAEPGEDGTYPWALAIRDEWNVRPYSNEDLFLMAPAILAVDGLLKYLRDGDGRIDMELARERGKGMASG